MRHGQEQSWWSRNWGWVVGIGCGCLLLPLLLVGACVGGLSWFVSQRLDTGTVVEDARALAEGDPQVQARLGTPIEIGWIAGNSSLTIDDSDGRAGYTRTMSGPNGSGELVVEAVLEDGEWRLTRVVARIDGETIDVLANAGGLPPPDADPSETPPTP